MHARSAIAILILILPSLGTVPGTLVQTFCRDSGEWGLARSLQQACYAADCHVGPQAEDNCAEEDCCEFDELPVRPFQSPSVETSLGRTPSVVVDALLPADSSAPGANRRPRHPSPREYPPGPGSATSAGYALPLLI